MTSGPLDHALVCVEDVERRWTWGLCLAHAAKKSKCLRPEPSCGAESTDGEGRQTVHVGPAERAKSVNG